MFMNENLILRYVTFENGESPLKESKHIHLEQSLFKWKYPLWYSQDVKMIDSILFETARSGIWYTDTIEIENSMIEAPKTFRRSKNIYLKQVQMPNALETMWNCDTIKLEQVLVKGDYFSANSQNIEADGLTIYGNYAFDGCKNVTIRNAKLLSKDAFWNCENVLVYDSFISGEYLAWNSKNVTFVNCTIESNQGLCYIENLVMRNCVVLNTTLAFEYSTVDVEIINRIDSIKNPISGRIHAEQIEEIILDKATINPEKTSIRQRDVKYAV